MALLCNPVCSFMALYPNMPKHIWNDVITCMVYGLLQFCLYQVHSPLEMVVKVGGIES